MILTSADCDLKLTPALQVLTSTRIMFRKFLKLRWRRSFRQRPGNLIAFVFASLLGATFPESNQTNDGEGQEHECIESKPGACRILDP